MAVEPAQRAGGPATAVEEELRGLQRANRVEREDARERRIVELRLEAAALTVAAPSHEPRPETAADPFPTLVDAVPEISPTDLTAEIVRGAIFHHGCILVRGLIASDHVSRLCDDIDATLAAIERCKGEGPDAAEPPWFVPFDPPGTAISPMTRAWSARAGTVSAADSPRTFFDLVEAFQDAGIPALMAEFVGGQPCVSIDKCAVRRVPATLFNGSPTGWHQDVYRFGRGTPVADVWVALSECGVDAPGLELVPRRIEETIDTDSAAIVPWIIEPDRVRVAAASAPFVSPRFEPGDAIIFDEMLLHRTGAFDGMTKPRYGADAWFFPAGTYLDDGMPALLF